jgi:O-acetyl-ADP-ribose deacetylase (regulator of RNase III)
MLQASHVIHAVGPHFEDESSDATLAAAITAALEAVRGRGLRSVAFPLVSTGSRGFPTERAAQVITGAVERWLEEHPGLLTEVRLVGFSRKEADRIAECLTADS